MQHKTTNKGNYPSLGVNNKNTLLLTNLLPSSKLSDIIIRFSLRNGIVTNCTVATVVNNHIVLLERGQWLCVAIITTIIIIYVRLTDTYRDY